MQVEGRLGTRQTHRQMTYSSCGADCDLDGSGIKPVKFVTTSAAWCSLGLTIFLIGCSQTSNKS